MAYTLPPTARAIEAAIGFAGLCQLVEAYAGARLYVPQKVSDGHPLAELLGLERARGLAGEFGGVVITVPKIVAAVRARRDQEIWERYRAGETADALAREYGLVWRSVQKIVRAVTLAGGVVQQRSDDRDSPAQLSFSWQRRAH